MNYKSLKKYISFFLSALIVILFSVISVSSASGTVYESESNNTFGTANRTYDDRDNYGKISSNSDIDWWVITFAQDGYVNFWLGSIPSGCDYDISLYSSNGSTLLATSTNRTGTQELIKYRVYAGSTYYIKVYSYSGYSTSQYKFRVKNYTLPPLLKGNLIWNIESIYYYVDSSAQAYLTPIANAANNWCYTGYGWTNLYPNTRTTNILDSAIDIYGYSTNDNSNGYTTFWIRENGLTGDERQSTYNVDWLFNKVYLNSYYMSSMSTKLQQAVVAHEMGHCFGLNENNTNQQSIMCQSGSGRAVTTVQQVDHDAFNLKHP